MSFFIFFIFFCLFCYFFFFFFFFFFSSRRRHTRCSRDWSSDVCSSDLSARPDEASRSVTPVTICIRLVISIPRQTAGSPFVGQPQGPELRVFARADRKSVV